MITGLRVIIDLIQLDKVALSIVAIIFPHNYIYRSPKKNSRLKRSQI